MNADLPAVLNGYSKDALATIARYRGLVPPGNKKDQLVGLLAEKLFTEDAIKRALAELSQRERQVLERLVLHGGEARTATFKRELLRAGLIVKSPAAGSYYEQYRGDPDRTDSKYFEDIVAGLTVAGLVLSSGAPASYSGSTTLYVGAPGELLFIPDAVLAHLPPAASLLPVPPPAAVGSLREAAAPTFQRDLFLYWRFVRRNEPALTARGLLPKRQLAKVAEGLVVRENVDAVAAEQELGRTYFLRRMLQELGLLAVKEERLVPTAQAPAFLALPPAERIRRACQAYLGSTRWNELYRLPDVTVDVGNNAYRDAAPAQIPKARQFVAALLAKLPAQRWVPFSYLADLAAIVDGDFLLRRDYRGPYHSSYYYGRGEEINPYGRSGNELGWTFVGMREGEQGWRMVEGGFIAAVLREPLHWLGLVDLGYHEDRPTAFRLTELGARLLRGEPLPAMSDAAGQVIVQPNFQVFAFGPVGEHILAALDRFADLVRADQAVEFRLSRESIYRAQQEGMAVAEVIAYLEEVGSAPLPQNVRRTLEEWASHHERIVMRRGVSLVHSATPELLEALLGDEALAGQLGRRLTPTAAVVARGAAGVRPLATALWARGHLPAVSRDGEAVPRGTLAVASDGRIAFQRRLPSIYLWRRLNPFAEQREGALWLTPESVQRAMNDFGLGAEEIVKQLEELHAGPLAAAVAERIKVWAKHWGDAALAVVALLRVKDEAVLAELGSDPKIGPFLRPFLPQGAIALVRPADREKLRAALAEKGIGVEDGW